MAKQKKKTSTLAKQERNRQKKALYKSQSDGPAYYARSQVYAETPWERKARLADLREAVERAKMEDQRRGATTEEKRVAQVPQSSNSKLSFNEQIERLERDIQAAQGNIVPLPDGVEDRLTGNATHDEQVMQHRKSVQAVSKLRGELDKVIRVKEEQRIDEWRPSGKPPKIGLRGESATSRSMNPHAYSTDSGNHRDNVYRMEYGNGGYSGRDRSRHQRSSHIWDRDYY